MTDLAERVAREIVRVHNHEHGKDDDTGWQLWMAHANAAIAVVKQHHADFIREYGPIGGGAGNSGRR